MSKKQQNKCIHEVVTDVYNACLWVFFGSIEECADAMRDQKVEEHIIKDWVDHVNSTGYNGMFTHNEEVNISLLWLPKLPITIMEYGTLVHEIEHYVFYLFDHIGMEHTEASDEAYAYMLGYIFREIDNIVCNLKEKGYE